MRCLPLFCLLLMLAACKEPAPQKQDTDRPVLRRPPLVAAPRPNPYAPVDISPLDVSYFPEDYPVLHMSGKIAALPLARVIYSRPHRQGRNIFGSLLKYGEPWRLGANEATEIEFFRAVTIQKKRIAKGRYILYAIPHEQSWTLVLNSGTYSWGLKQDPSKDLYRFEVPVQRTENPVENFTMVFEKGSTNTSTHLLMAWDDVVVRLPLQF